MVFAASIPSTGLILTTRIALGATRGDVIGMVVTSALGLVAIGLVAGVPAALWMKRYAAHVLAAVAANQLDAPVVLPVNATIPVVIAVTAMLGLALIASYVPARRAMNVNPMTALRTE